MGQLRLSALLFVLVGALSLTSTSAKAADSAMSSFRNAVVKQKYKKAAEILSVAAEAGNGEAQYQLGVLYRLGIGVPADEQLAKQWLERAREGDNKQATAVLTRLQSAVETPHDTSAKGVPSLRGQSGYIPPVDANEPTVSGITWLMRSAARNQIPQTSMLVQSTSQINATSAGGGTSLHLAGQLAGPEIVTLLLNAGIDKDAVDQSGRTALMIAAKSNDIDATVNALLSANADITRQDLQGDTALLLAARSCHAETVSTLIFKNAKPVANVDGETPLMAAIKNCPGSDILASLTALGGINAVDKMDRTPLWYAAMHGNVAGISLLLKLGASVNGADKDGLPPLLVAAARGRPEAVAELVVAGADTAVTSSRGNSASHLAVAKGCVQCLSVLVRKGPDIDRKNDWGETALALATRAGSQEAVTVLIKAGANPDARDKKRDTPRKLAERLKLNAILAAMAEGR